MNKRDIVDDIDALVDQQLRQEASGYDHNINQPMCPRCGRHFHGLPLTEQVAVMYALGHYHPSYVAAQDTSPVVCEGPDFISYTASVFLHGWPAFLVGIVWGASTVMLARHIGRWLAARWRR
jgi:hypothetical protein